MVLVVHGSLLSPRSYHSMIFANKTYRFLNGFQLLGQQLGERSVPVVGCYHGNVVAALQQCCVDAVRCVRVDACV